MKVISLLTLLSAITTATRKKGDLINVLMIS